MDLELFRLAQEMGDNLIWVHGQFFEHVGYFTSLQVLISKTRVNFTNILQEAFTRVDPKSAKDSQVISYFALLGSMRIKAVHKHDNEIEPSI